MSSDVGRQFAEALSIKDYGAIEQLLAPDVDFKGMTPGQFWEANNPRAVVAEILQEWFEDHDTIEALLKNEAGSVGDRNSIKYRMKVRNPDGTFEVEQQAYYETDGNHITMMRVLCSGFRPTLS